MKTSEVRPLYVLDICFVAYHNLGHSFPLELFHSSDLEPHASPGLPECERRNSIYFATYVPKRLNGHLHIPNLGH